MIISVQPPPVGLLARSITLRLLLFLLIIYIFFNPHHSLKSSTIQAAVKMKTKVDGEAQNSTASRQTP